MNTLYRELLKSDETPKEFKNELENAEIILIDNVAKYFYESEQDTWKIEKEFPNLAPPFDNFWMEYQMPYLGVHLDGEYHDITDAKGIRIGVLFTSADSKERGLPATWLYNSTLVIGNEKGISDKYFQYGFLVKEDGSLYVPFGGNYLAMFCEKREDSETYEYMFTNVFPMLLAISFLHCKNVEIIPHKPDEEKQQRRNRGSSRIKYKVLQIEPMKKILREEGRSEETGLRNALHICRGHFKDFSKGKGLFGKYKDMFWWDSQVRGNAERGAVIKDYNVNLQA